MIRSGELVEHYFCQDHQDWCHFRTTCWSRESKTSASYFAWSTTRTFSRSTTPSSWQSGSSKVIVLVCYIFLHSSRSGTQLLNPWFSVHNFYAGTSVSSDMEILLVQKLRNTCGGDFVSKLQKMLKDKMLSKVCAYVVDHNPWYRSISLVGKLTHACCMIGTGGFFRCLGRRKGHRVACWGRRQRFRYWLAPRRNLSLWHSYSRSLAHIKCSRRAQDRFAACHGSTYPSVHEVLHWKEYRTKTFVGSQSFVRDDSKPLLW